MRYITAEQFKEQPEEVQQVFLDWWKPEKYDMYSMKFGQLGDMVKNASGKYDAGFAEEFKGIDVMPLFTLQQLWEFIEDKTDYPAIVDYIADEYWIDTDGWWNENDKCFIDKDKLEAFWKCACEVARVIK